MINRVLIKGKAQRDISQAQPSAYLVTLAYLLILYVINIVLVKLGEPLLDWYDWNAERILHGLYPQAPNKLNILVIAELLSIALNVFMQVITVGYMLYALKVSRGLPAGYADIGNGFNLFWKITGILVLQTIFVTLWSFLLIIPGIVASYRYRMAYYILLDHPEYGCLQCIRESKSMMYGHKAELFVLDLSFIGWYLLCALTFGILLIWRMPYFEVTYANFYGQLLLRRQSTGYGWYSNYDPNQNL